MILYKAYEDMLLLLRENDYEMVGFEEGTSVTDKKTCILRHDIDFDLDKALVFAQLENGLGVSSTYFVLLRTDFYNPFSLKSMKVLEDICTCGHQIGLHFDEFSYPPPHHFCR